MSLPISPDLAESLSPSSSGLYTHTAAKLVFVRIFRHSEHVYSHTVLGWTVWIMLCFAGTAVAAVLAIAVPIFSYLIGITASLFAAWYTYGLAGFFWLHDVYHLKGGMDGIRRRPIGTTLAVLTILSGAFICVAGTYVSVKVGVRIFVPDSLLIRDSSSSKHMPMVQSGDPSFASERYIAVYVHNVFVKHKAFPPHVTNTHVLSIINIIAFRHSAAAGLKACLSVCDS